MDSIKAVVFDLDGTLTHKSKNSWKAIWESLGYTTDKESYFASLYIAYIKEQITHQQWCDLTCEAFRAKFMHESLLKELSKNIVLIGNFNSAMEKIKSNGCTVHLASGNINQLVYHILEDKVRFFDSINANNMVFDENGYLSEIQGTNFDFEGKAKLINEIAKKYQISTSEILFVGNSDNDEWAYTTGCHTLCINPDLTNPDDKKIWHHSLGFTNDLGQVADFDDELEMQ